MTPNNGSRIQVPMSVPDLSRPQEVRIGNQIVPGPLASPASMAFQPQANQPPMLLTFGGLTKLEHGALLIAAALAGSVPTGDTYGDVTADSAAIAAAVLAECDRRQKAEQQPQP